MKRNRKIKELKTLFISVIRLIVIVVLAADCSKAVSEETETQGEDNSEETAEEEIEEISEQVTETLSAGAVFSSGCYRNKL